MKRWGNMARVFTRIGRDIVIAVKAGVLFPDFPVWGWENSFESKKNNFERWNL